MKIKLLTISDNPIHEGWLKNEASLKKHGWDYQHITAPFEFGFQLKVIQKWINEYSGDATHILYTDCFDTVCFAGADEVITKFYEIMLNTPGGYFQMFISCEKNCYPLMNPDGTDNPDRAAMYPESPTPWKFVNGGGWLADIDFIKDLFNRMPPTYNDQVWLMDAYLANRDSIKLDHNCEIFQTIAFSNQDEWEFNVKENRLFNLGTNTYPVLFHANGHTPMEWLWEAAK